MLRWNERISIEMGMSKMVKRYLILSIIFLATSILLMVLVNCLPGFGQWYSVHIYSNIVNIVGRLFGFVPFSVSEILLYVMFGTVLVNLVLILMKKRKLINGAIILLFSVSVLFFLYTANCGVNYHRTSFADSAEIHADDYSVDELVQVCMILTDQVNRDAELVMRDKDGVMVHESSLSERAANVMNTLSDDYPQLAGFYPKAKGLMIPWVLSVQKITGIYSPFTIEANYNTGMTDYNIPFIACHELSHLRGFMQEEEANFIAYLACIQAEDADFSYSGSLRGWISCMNLLYQNDFQRWAEIRDYLNPKVEADLQANRLYWQQFDGHTAELAEKINDNYLKANGQTDGIKSYSRMADLIVAYYLR